jgi:hypothetical protein
VPSLERVPRFYRSSEEPPDRPADPAVRRANLPRIGCARGRNSALVSRGAEVVGGADEVAAFAEAS